jgi:hypothetical protein
MTEPDPKELAISRDADAAQAVEPSWKPLLWLVAGLAVLVGLGELLFDALLEVGETLFLVLVEAPEEFLEDWIEEWLKENHPHDADRYSEMITAIGLTPVKILTGLILARWLWLHARRSFFPRARAFLWRQWLAVRLAWKALFWPYKILAGLAVLGVLAVLI